MNLLKYFLLLFLTGCYSAKTHLRMATQMDKKYPYQSGCYVYSVELVTDTLIHDFYILYQNGCFFHGGITTDSKFEVDSQLILSKHRNTIEGWGYYSCVGEQIKLKEWRSKSRFCTAKKQAHGELLLNEKLILRFPTFMAGGFSTKMDSDSMAYVFKKLKFKPDSVNIVTKE